MTHTHSHTYTTIVIVTFICLLSPCLSTSASAQSIPKGNAAWVIDDSSVEGALWDLTIAKYNSRAMNASSSSVISILYTLGATLECHPNDTQPLRNTFTIRNQDAAIAYSKVPGVEHVFAMIDGQMDDSNNPFAPNFAILTPTQVQQWAQQTASEFCQYSYISGLILHLQPYLPPFDKNVLLYLQLLGDALRTGTCVTSQYPEGRFISLYTFGDYYNRPLAAALGPNGFATIRAHDLATVTPGFCVAVTYYDCMLEAALESLQAEASQINVPFRVAIPGSASQMEFETYFNNGKVVTGNPQRFYLTAAFNQADAAQIIHHPSFIGFGLWSFQTGTYNSYPYGSENIFLPSNAFADYGSEVMILQRMQWKSKQKEGKRYQTTKRPKRLHAC